MSYLGRVELKSSEIRRVNVTGSTSATHTLTWTPPSEQSLIITINGVKQQNNYSFSGTTLTLDTALVSTDAMEVIGILDIGEATVPPDDSITNAMVKSDAAIAKTKLASLDIVNADVNASAAIALSKLNVTGTGTSSNFLRGDGSWNAAGVDTLAALTDATISSSDPTPSSNPSAVGHLWLNSTSGEGYIATDASTGANVWKNIGDGTGQIAPYMAATGGTITTDGDYKIHTFTGDGTFTVTRVGPVGTVESLVIAGGGGAGSNEHGGGGGAGGYRNSYGSETSGGGGSSEAVLTVTAQAYSITVGAGGSGAAAGPNANGVAGNNSVFSTITSTAGGYGSGYPNVGGNGGSGGGSGGQSGGGVSSGTSNQGYAGGGNNVVNGAGAGGGGAGAIGATTTGSYLTTGGAGGNGVASSITGASVTRGGGGGGGAVTAGAGGSGGGGSDGNGTANTGGGGGGQAGSPATSAGGNGGSGTVIIRYQFQ